MDLPDANDSLACSTVSVSDDKTVNIFGRANGRLEPGRFTFQSSNGCSVVDYMYIIRKPFNFKYVSKLKILEPCQFSDHCAMYLCYAYLYVFYWVYY